MASLTKTEQTALDKTIQHIRDVCGDNLISVILYGSKARGDSLPESDIDIMILVRNRNKVDRDKLYDFLLLDDVGYDINISLNIYEGEYFNQLSTMHVPFVENVLKEGETLWAVV
ncbi:DNA polymerase beta domain protein region [Desulfitobacterium hafniense DCB-2]|uniref:DNA polymerase beta domain protein region n=1 Tax=Desulfitobacterium hafniense (strain DSM 10664 / DCB-2) TaxID=272564 RepID=B8FVV7_DESHD|nr:nucleotidyltransferase domain-containing protein [Desulfitobacterium hafniense]ACL18743.1 DNA polymerase beta domain protein region [Desulfitobacterium hafniense DCB-2]